MAKYSIKDLEKISGIKAHTIRIWEQRYNILSPSRNEGNIRIYSDEDIKMLLKVVVLNKNGIKISKIAGLSPNQLSEKIEQTTNLDSTGKLKIEQLLVAAIGLDEEKFERVLVNEINDLGFEKVMEATIYPFFERIGVLWLAGHLTPGQEHFISNIIRQKIISAIDQLPIVSKTATNKLLAFLPETELHEIGLLYYTYHFKKKGYSVTYLGQTTPFKDVVETIELRKPNFILCSFVQEISEQAINEYVDALLVAAPTSKQLFSGFQAKLIKNKNVTLLSHIVDVKNLF